MTFQKRWAIAISVLFLSAIFYGAGRYYSPALIQYVVEQSLIQKAPAGEDPAHLQKRLRKCLAAIPDQDARLERLLRISGFLEKSQSLTPEGLDELLATENH